MKKTFLFAVVAAAMMVSCGANNKSDNKPTESDNATTETVDDSAPMSVETPTDAPVVASDIVYLDLAYLSISSKIYLTEGVAFEKKFTDFQKRVQTAQSTWQNKEQSIAAEMQKIQSDYENGMITSITAQQKSDDLQKRYVEYQQGVEKEAKKLADEEAKVAEQQQVLDNRFAKLVELAVKSVNADGRYKMIISKDVVVDANEQLNISALVLAEMDRLYDEGALN